MNKTKQRESTFIHATCTCCDRVFTDPTNVLNIHENKDGKCCTCEARGEDIAEKFKEIERMYGGK